MSAKVLEKEILDFYWFPGSACGTAIGGSAFRPWQMGRRALAKLSGAFQN